MTVWKQQESCAEVILRKIIAFVAVLAIVIPLMTPQVFADSYVSISGGDNVKSGDTFTVTVTYSGDNIGRVSGQLTYDTNRVSYISGGSSLGNSGYVQLSEAGTTGSIIFNLKFQAISEGSVNLEVTTNEAYDLNESAINHPSDSKSITIASGTKVETTVPTEETTSEAKPFGVDEKVQDLLNRNEDAEPQDNSWIPWVMVAVALLILIIVIITLLASKKKRRKKAAQKAAKKNSNAQKGRMPDAAAGSVAGNEPQSWGPRQTVSDDRANKYDMHYDDDRFATRMYTRSELSQKLEDLEMQTEESEVRNEPEHGEMRRELQKYRERMRSQDDSGIDRKADTQTNFNSWDNWSGVDREDDDINKW